MRRGPHAGTGHRIAPTSTLLEVQAVIAETILHDQANFGIYQSNPTPVPQVLADVRAIGDKYLVARV